MPRTLRLPEDLETKLRRFAFVETERQKRRVSENEIVVEALREYLPEEDGSTMDWQALFEAADNDGDLDWQGGHPCADCPSEAGHFIAAGDLTDERAEALGRLNEAAKDDPEGLREWWLGGGYDPLPWMDADE